MCAKIADNQTPLMKQYFGFKQKYPGALLLFRVGDFYETFGEDAITASKVLGIVLTKRGAGSPSEIELAGFPHHSLDTYLPKLVRAGHRVAICDQLEDPKMAKGIVKRGVTELVTPGVVFNDKVLDATSSNFLASVYFESGLAGVAFLDISTGEFFVAEGSHDYIDKLLNSLKPSEIIVSKPQLQAFKELTGDRFYQFPLEDWVFQFDYAEEKLLNHFGTSTLKGFGIGHLKAAIVAAGSALYYLEHNQQTNIRHINSISRIDEDKFVWFDQFTIRNLEVLYPSHPGGKTLADVLDNTLTPMGSRLLKKWIVLPLKDLHEINSRLNTVESLILYKEASEDLTGSLTQCGDMERIISKISLLRANPREVLQLGRALECVRQVKQICANLPGTEMQVFSDQLNPCHSLVERISKELKADAPVLVNKGGVINDGVNEELDELRGLQFSGKEKLLEIQKREIERTGIPSLKIAFNNVFGYYLEVTNTHKDKVPGDWIRKQTLTNAERYITQELKTYEDKILSAESRILEIETQIYNTLLQDMNDYVSAVQLNSQLLARLDCLLSFAKISVQNKYTRPVINEGFDLILKECRHPVIEKQLSIDNAYIPNDIELSRDVQRIVILTGPNMSGKSAVLRQTALAVLMGQIGCYVAAGYAEFGLVDRIYTRVGASDNISGGESTFMVEMIETAGILNNISSRSLILLDEIGRGTSTFDGVSLAWAIAEFLGKHPDAPKTIFATHYHELNELEKNIQGIVNYHISVKETKDKVIFLRKLVKGGSEHSFGIHVARMAGVPVMVLSRAEEILHELEKDRASISGRETLKQIKVPQYQLTMFGVNDPKLEELHRQLRSIELNAMTPIDAFMKLQELKKLL
ncbi:MAG: DNA mismatch repair protein MutS [Bacteroidetes bacterium]|nr:DNA mismatch repair protein MutS [Bacteroidota bacterium]